MWHLNRKWAVRAYLLAIPCLWWQGVSQTHAQAIAWQVATVGLVSLAVASASRMWRSGLAAGVMIGCLCSALFHWPSQGYPMLMLLTLIGWAMVWALIQLSPDAAWIEQSLVWLALVNVGYSLSQCLGYDPLFATDQMTGFMGRINTLSALWLICVPLARGWVKWVLVVAILWLHNWTAMIGLGVLGMLWAWKAWPKERVKLVGVVCAVAGGAVGWWVLHPNLWPMKAVPRILTWQETLGQALWSPLWGYGLGARSAMSNVGSAGDIGYNVWLEMFHAGGVLLLAPCLLVLWRIWKGAASPARTALLLTAAAGCTQSLWNTTGMVVVTLALVAAWELRRLNAV